MATIVEITDGKALQPFIDMAKPLKDTKSMAGIIRQALSAPNVFVFGELLSLDNVKQVSKIRNSFSNKTKSSVNSGFLCS
jgi:hypothetical protein